jgi:xylulokinase
MNTSNTTPAHVARAVMEGVTLGMAYGLRRMERLGVKPDVIRLTGGGSLSAVWRQMCADIFGFPVVTLRSSEGAALGAAIQALSAGEESGVEERVGRLAPADEGSRREPGASYDYAARLEEQNWLRHSLFAASR